ncbi:MAG: hypothetical protein ACU0C9_08820 [Paracoccaceae bacterium]
MGGRAASLGLAERVREMAKLRRVPVFDAGGVVSPTDIDPVHIDADSHIVLGRALASWLQKLHEHA